VHDTPDRFLVCACVGVLCVCPVGTVLPPCTHPATSTPPPPLPSPPQLQRVGYIRAWRIDGVTLGASPSRAHPESIVFQAHTVRVTGLACVGSSHHLLATCGDDGKVRVWDAHAEWAMVHEFQASEHLVSCLVYMEHHGFLATGSSVPKPPEGGPRGGPAKADGAGGASAAAAPVPVVSGLASSAVAPLGKSRSPQTAPRGCVALSPPWLFSSSSSSYDFFLFPENPLPSPHSLVRMVKSHGTTRHRVHMMQL
jgi:hypothetical protein